ncbi:MAG: type II toxin-antitoxin system HigB family toxin [Prevotella sp.]|nr:type II toxin-antitoxin system HigB family toxin [Prevotella sp.]
MRVISQKKIKDFYEQPFGEKVKIPLQQWYCNVKNRKYRSLSQILVDFDNTIRVKGLYIFDIDGGKCKIATSIYFDTGCVYIRFVGTDADYKKFIAELKTEGTE